jgi:hypothetical protein
MLDLPGLEKNLFRDDDAIRTRRIHAVFKWTLLVCLGLGVSGAVASLVQGDRDNESFSRLLRGLVCGVFLGGLAAILYGAACQIRLERTAGEELRRRQRKTVQGAPAGDADEVESPSPSGRIVADHSDASRERPPGAPPGEKEGRISER